jgi:hypothetical protein
VIKEMFRKDVRDASRPKRPPTAQVNLYVGMTSAINIHPAGNWIGATSNLDP